MLLHNIMGWLQNIFKSKELLYLETLYADTKKDKEQLQKENKELRITLSELNKQVIELTIKYQTTVNNTNNSNETVVDVPSKPEKLAPKEQFVKDLCDQYENYDEVLANCGMKEPSLKVYLSRIRTKGYKIVWEN